MKIASTNRSKDSFCLVAMRRRVIGLLLLALTVAGPLFGQTFPGVEQSPATNAASTGTNMSGIDISSLLAKEAKNELAISGDYLLGEGHVTIPIGFALNSRGFAARPVIESPNFTGNYFGGSMSYSYGDAWFFDVSYAMARYNGDVDVPPLTFPGISQIISTHYSIDEDWYQAYVRYGFPALRGKRIAAYVRAGVSYVPTTLDVSPNQLATLNYAEHDEYYDITGNIGFGVAYSLIRKSRLTLGLQLEGEGFYGERNQSDTESASVPSTVVVLGQPASVAHPTDSTTIDNTLWGGTALVALRLQYYLGRARLARVFLEGGMLGTYTTVGYSKYGFGDPDELLYGPYVKVGLRVSF